MEWVIWWDILYLITIIITSKYSLKYIFSPLKSFYSTEKEIEKKRKRKKYDNISPHYKTYFSISQKLNIFLLFSNWLSNELFFIFKPSNPKLGH